MEPTGIKFIVLMCIVALGLALAIAELTGITDYLIAQI